MLFILIGINIIVYILQVTGKINSEKIAQSYDTVFRRKEYYRIITSAFGHASVYHILFNMLALYNVGNAIRLYFGIKGFLIIYFISIIIGHILSLLIHHDNGESSLYSLGASGGVCALIGALLVVMIHLYGFIGGISQMLLSLISLVVISILPGIDGTNHICCFAIGIAIAYIMMLII